MLLMDKLKYTGTVLALIFWALLAGYLFGHIIITILRNPL
jgi:hypothetical protein